jgi:hypothetical protein
MFFVCFFHGASTLFWAINCRCLRLETTEVLRGDDATCWLVQTMDIGYDKGKVNLNEGTVRAGQ